MAWSIPFEGWYVDYDPSKGFVWQLRKELVKAIDQRLEDGSLDLNEFVVRHPRFKFSGKNNDFFFEFHEFAPVYNAFPECDNRNDVDRNGGYQNIRGINKQSVKHGGLLFKSGKR